MSEFVLVRHENGIVAPVGRAFAESRDLDIVEGDAVDLTGKPVKAVRDNGRPVKPKKNLPAAKASEKAVVPSEGAAEPALTDTTKEN